MSIKKSKPPAPEKKPKLPVAPTPRRRQTATNAKDAILEAAERVLNAHGPQALKLADIARAAKVTNGNVLHHFQTVDGLQDALMTRIVARLIDRVLKITQSPWTEDQRMTLAIREMFEAFEEKSASRLAAWLVMSERTKRLDDMRDAIAKVLSEIDRARTKGPRSHLPRENVQAFVMLGILNALAAGLFGKELGRLFGVSETMARDTALGALLILSSSALHDPK